MIRLTINRVFELHHHPKMKGFISTVSHFENCVYPPTPSNLLTRITLPLCP